VASPRRPRGSRPASGWSPLSKRTSPPGWSIRKTGTGTRSRPFSPSRKIPAGAVSQPQVKARSSTRRGVADIPSLGDPAPRRDSARMLPMPDYRVLLVEDDPNTRSRLAQVIQDHPQLRLLAAVGSCAEARRELDKSRPDVLLTDLGLPDGDGVELIREVR